jgi:hypothetical protein
MRCAGGGYLANVAPSEWAQTYEAALPESMRGAEFLARYGVHWDTATQVCARAASARALPLSITRMRAQDAPKCLCA